MGAVVVTISTPNPVDFFGSQKVVFGTLHLSTSYATAGDTFTNGQFGLEEITFLSINTGNGASLTTAWQLVANLPTSTGLTAAGTIQAFGTAGSAGALAEASSNTDLHTFTANFMAVGW